MADHDDDFPELDSALSERLSSIDEELAAGDIASIKQHIDQCAPCLTEYDIEVIIKKLVARSCTERAPQPQRLVRAALDPLTALPTGTG